MRSHPLEPARVGVRSALLAMAAVACSPLHAVDMPSASAAASRPLPPADAHRIEQAVATLRADPLVDGTKKTWNLKLDPSDDKPEPQAHLPRWLEDFARFLADTSRLLLYGIAAVLVAIVVVTARRYIDWRRQPPRPADETVATSVRGLDVRPGSLPADIGAAAWALWQAQDVRGALALLYRGALSRLIHRHDLPIASSSTEGECLALARAHLAAPSQVYLERLVGTWQAHVYGRHAVTSIEVERLCMDFAPRLDEMPVDPPLPAVGLEGASA